MKTYRKTAIIVGILFILGTLAGFIGAFVLGPLLGEPVDLGKIAANGNRLTLGALLILTMGLALAMVPVLMFPIFKKHNEPLALGYLVFRGALESMAYIASVVGFLALGTLGKEFVKAGAPVLSHFQTLGALFMAGNGWISAMTSIVFSLSALMFNGLLFGTRLIPRWLSVWGFAGARSHSLPGRTTILHVWYHMGDPLRSACTSGDGHGGLADRQGVQSLGAGFRCRKSGVTT